MSTSGRITRSVVGPDHRGRGEFRPADRRSRRGGGFRVRQGWIPSAADKRCPVTESASREHSHATGGPMTSGRSILYQGALIVTHRDRVCGPSGRREAAGDVVHRQGVPTPSDGPHTRPKRRLPRAFGQRRARLPMPGIGAAHAPCRKPWEDVSMSHYHRSLVLAGSMPDSGVINGVSVGPPGTTTLTVMPLPSSSFDQAADPASRAALLAP